MPRKRLGGGYERLLRQQRKQIAKVRETFHCNIGTYYLLARSYRHSLVLILLPPPLRIQAH